MSNKEKSGIKIFGVINLIFGFWLLITFAQEFLVGVILNWLTDFSLHNLCDNFITLVIGRLFRDISYIFSFLLLCSGIGMLSMKNDSRKLAIFSSIIIALPPSIGSFLVAIYNMFHPDTRLNIDPIYVVPFLILLIYSIFLIRYLNKPKIKEIFNDKDVKLSFKIPIIVIIVAYVCPLFLKYLALFLGTYFMN